MSRIILGLVMVLIGISALTGISLFRFAFAIFLILIGLRVMFGRRYRYGVKVEASSSEEDVLNEVAIFSSIKKDIRSDNFKGGSAVMVFAGGEIDLSEAKTEMKEIDVEFVSIFGGGKLIVPRDWRVRSEGVAVLGGYEVKSDTTASGPILNLKGAAIFGGVEVVNK